MVANEVPASADRTCVVELMLVGQPFAFQPWWLEEMIARVRETGIDSPRESPDEPFYLFPKTVRAGDETGFTSADDKTGLTSPDDRTGFKSADDRTGSAKPPGNDRFKRVETGPRLPVQE